MTQIKVTEPFGNWWAQPVSVVINGECNHADSRSVWYDKDGEDYDEKPADYIWTNEEKECATCGAQWNQFDETWQETIQSIRYMNKWFDDLRNGRI